MTEDGHYNSLIKEIHAFVTSFNFQSLSAESAENMLLAINKHIYIYIRRKKRNTTKKKTTTTKTHMHTKKEKNDINMDKDI